jgi:hypothetical protein
MPRHLTFVLTSLLVGFVATVAMADEPAIRPNRPVAALIDTTEHPATSLLEAKLLTGEAAQWVERTEVERVTAEQQLQAAFGAEGVKQRSSLGRLLKADVLVLIREVKSPKQNGESVLDCVVCETSQGLRLKAFTIEAQGDLDAVADHLSKAVNQGLAKYGERIDAIVAVPPFMSDDLGLESNYLQTAYAKLVEQALLDQPGLLVVELGEAEAISRELTLADADAVRRKSAPLVVLGRYRHDGLGAKRTLRMSLGLTQLQKQLSRAGVRELNPSDAPQWILGKTNELLPQLLVAGREPKAAPSVKEEARQLAERGRQFQSVGSWPEALVIFEASLLLDPTQEEVRADAVRVITPLSRNLSNQYSGSDWVLPLLALHERGLHHLETWLKTAPDTRALDRPNHGSDFSIAFDWSLPFSFKDVIKERPDLQAPIDEFQHRRKEAYLRIAQMRIDLGHADHTENQAWDVLAVSRLSDAQRYASIARMAERWKDVPDIGARVVRMTFHGYAYVDDTPEFREFLARLSQSKHASLQAAAGLVEQQAIRGWKLKAELASKTAPAEPKYVDDRLIEVKLTNTAVKESQNFDAATLAGPDMSLLWRNRVMFMQRKGGFVEPLYVHPELNLWMSSVAYDGKFVWTTARQNQKPLTLIVIDPETKQSWAFGREAGLPLVDGNQMTDGKSHDMRVAAVGHCKAVVVGYTGNSWAAAVDFSSKKSLQVDLFFEARKAEGTTEVSDFQQTVDKVFQPAFLYTLEDVGGPGRRVIVGRDSASPAIRDRPLIIDPANRRVRVANYELSGITQQHYLATHQRALYVLESNAPHPPHVMRISYPGESKEEFIPTVDDGHLAIDRRGLHIIGKKWWIANLQTGTVHTVADQVAWHFSNNFSYGKDPKNPDFGVPLQNTSKLRRVLPTLNHGVLAGVEKGMERKLYSLSGQGNSE